MTIPKNAKRAGMKVIAVTTTRTKKELGKADLFIRDFSGLYRKNILEFMDNY